MGIGFVSSVVARRWSQHAVLMVVVALAGDHPRAEACELSFHSYPRVADLNNIYIDYDSFNIEMGLLPDYVNHAVHTATSPWNNNANSGYFRIAGTRNDVLGWIVGHLQDPEQCVNEHANDLLVFAFDCDSPIAAASAFPICGEVTSFVAVCAHAPYDFTTAGFPSLCLPCEPPIPQSLCCGDPDPPHCCDPDDDEIDCECTNQADLPGVLTHEFGHVLGMGHPSTSCTDPTPAVMELGCPAQTGLRMRQLYPDDVLCSNKRGFRDVSVEGATQSGSSWVFGAYTFAESFAIKGAPGWVNGQIFRMMTRKAPGSSDDRTRFVLREGAASGSPPSQGVNVGYSGTLPTTSWWREAPWNGDIRLFLNHTNVATWEAGTMVEQYAYDASAINAGLTFNAWLRRCSAASPASCPREFIQSAERLYFAWDNYANNTVAVWQHQNRMQDDGEDFEIRIGKGVIQEDVLGFTQPTGLFTAAAPAIACDSHQVSAPDGAFDCILVWTDLDDPQGRIRMRFFYESLGSPPGPSGSTLFWSNHEVLQPVNHLSRTAFPLSIWRNDGRWWLAHSLYDNRVRILRSDNGVNWTWHYTIPEWSITAAAVDVVDNSSTIRHIVMSRPH